MTATTSVLGYAWPLVASPGEEIAFHLSSPTLPSAEVALVRVRCADPDPAGPGIRVQELEAPFERTLALTYQPIRPGSCAVVADAPVLSALRSFTVGAFLWPTLPGDKRGQTLLSRWRDDTQEGWR